MCVIAQFFLKSGYALNMAFRPITKLDLQKPFCDCVVRDESSIFIEMCVIAHYVAFRGCIVVTFNLPTTQQRRIMPYPKYDPNAPIENRFLAALPPEELDCILPKLEEVELEFGDKIYERGGEIDYVYFPTGSLFSLLAVGPDELTLEMGVVGREGMAGYPVFIEDSISDFRVIVLGSGKAKRMTTADFVFESKRNETLRQMMLQFGRLRFAQASLASACHRFHGVEKRLVRWLLMTSDRLQNSEIPVTNTFLSYILGLSPKEATDAVDILKKRELVRYSKDRFEIIDRPNLLAAACNCYTLIRNEENSYPVPV